MGILTCEFIEFAKTLANNQSDYTHWQRFILTHYEDPSLEKARALVVRICQQEESIGYSTWPLSQGAVEQINRLVAMLERQVSESNAHGGQSSDVHSLIALPD